MRREICDKIDKMVKEKKEVKKIKKEEGVSKQTKYMSYFIIFIMIFSIAGFAILSGGGIGSNNVGGEHTNVALQENLFQNPQTGETYWGAVLNGEQFIFFNGVEGYDSRVEMSELANEIKSKEFINVYVDTNYESFDSIYVVEKALRGLEISTQRVVGNLSCSSNTLVFVNSNFDLNSNVSSSLNTDGCMVFDSVQGEEYIDSDILVYHLIK